jgi:hypothetical protein
MQQALVVKTRKNYHYYYFYDLLRHDALTNWRDGSLKVAMVVPPIQSIGGDDDRTYTSYMPPRTNRVHGLPCRPSWRAWQ